MLKKVLLGILVLTVVGAAGAAFAYKAASQDSALAEAGPNPLADGQSLAGIEVASQVQQGVINTASQPVAQGAQGEPWQANGTIEAVDDFGFDFTLDSGETVYIELGPPDFWQAQGVELLAGQPATVIGTLNDGMIHASQVELADQQVLQVRSEIGQPLWSGGVNNSKGQSARQADGQRIPNPQAQVDEWITVEGTLLSFQGANMTIGKSDGDLLSFQTGQPRFFASQGITFQVGDELRLVGFYEGDQFMAGDITQISTGLRVMLRDPNGRPLWAGPGNGNGKGGNNGFAQNGH